ncbi:MAG TPA: ABC transporter ATP-binding protein [Gemmataceae bacterium]|jgi:ABC-2 type transport system ATP-binding protein|nr:ABC transporter ATP-binding protein [Gemmataceae bacterium]
MEDKPNYNVPAAVVDSAFRIPHSEFQQPLLLLDHVTKWYGPVIGINQVTLELHSGIIGLVGANGSGKTTLLRLATGQLRPDLGRVSVRGLDTWTWQAKRLIGYCPDADVFYEEMSGFEFVETMARLCGYSRREAKQRTEGVIEQVGMVGRCDRKIRGYSKGMRQRIKLAQALLHDPALLVLDEPLSGIDPIGRQDSLELFQELARRGKCLLISSHELEELEKLTDRVAIMARGRIAAVGPVRQIRELLDRHPMTIRIDVAKPRQLAGDLLAFEEVVGVDLAEAANLDSAFGTLIVRARNPRKFFQNFGKLVVQEGLDVRRLESLDDSTQAVLDYLLGGRSA